MLRARRARAARPPRRRAGAAATTARRPTRSAGSARHRGDRSQRPVPAPSRRDRHHLEAAHVRLVRALETRLVHLVVGEAVADLLEHDARFEPRERLPDADVVAVAEVDLARRAARDVEALRIGELALVAAGRARDERDARALRNPDAVDRRIAQRDAALELR